MVATVPSMIGQFNMNNIQILQELGYEVHVACDFNDRSVWTDERVEKFKNQLEEISVKYFQVDFSRSPLKIWKHRKSYVQLKKLFEENAYTFTHCHTPIASVICRLVAHKMKVKCIYTAHGFHFFKGAPLKNWVIYYPIEKFLSRWTDMLITINKEDYQRAKNKMNANEVVLIPGVGVDTKKFADCTVDKEAKRKEIGIPPNGVVLLSVGELSDRKNQMVILEALNILKNKNIYYLMVGTGYLKEEYEKLVKKYDLENNVKMLGFRTDIGELCGIADCFIHLAKQEGLAIAPLEAMACGLPLISSEIRGVKDYTTDGISGCCITDFSNAVEVANAINNIYSDTEFRFRCGANNLIAVQKYCIENSNVIMHELYNSGIFGGGVQTTK